MADTEAKHVAADDSENAASISSAQEKAVTDAEAPSSQAADPFAVGWDSPTDPENPLNWTKAKKARITAVISAITFVTPLASSMFAPGVSYVLSEFHESSIILASFVVSVYLIGYSTGPLIFAPLCEIYGRARLYQVTNVLFVIFTIACAVAPSFNSLIGFRFLAGCAGAAPLVMGSGTIADLYPREQRGSKMAIFSLGPLLGPVIGPVAGAFLAEDVGWRWVFWLITIIAGVITALSFVILKETYATVILARKAAKLRKSTGDDRYRSILDNGATPGKALRDALFRPSKLFLTPLVFVFTLYLSLIYGILYLLFVTITQVFEDGYGWSTGIAGLSYLGIGIGLLLGMALFGATSDRRIRTLQAKAAAAGNDTENAVPPEVRLEGMLAASVCIPIALFWYGWSAEKQIHWIMPIIGTGWFGFGMIGIFLSVQTYLVDCFPRYAASVTATHTVVRSLLGAFLPLAGGPLYKNLGLGWGNSVLGFIAVGMIPIPLLLLKFGARIRTNPKFQPRL